MPARLVLVRLMIFVSIAAALLLVTAGGGLALAGHRVSGSSMLPTLADDELFAANPFDRRPVRFDVVLLRSSDSAAEAQEPVKRIIGLPGDRVEIVPAAGSGAPAIRVAAAGRRVGHRCRLRSAGVRGAPGPNAAPPTDVPRRIPPRPPSRPGGTSYWGTTPTTRSTRGRSAGSMPMRCAAS